jgi:hypothetical protein
MPVYSLAQVGEEKKKKKKKKEADGPRTGGFAFPEGSPLSSMGWGGEERKGGKKRKLMAMMIWRAEDFGAEEASWPGLISEAGESCCGPRLQGRKMWCLRRCWHRRGSEGGGSKARMEMASSG